MFCHVKHLTAACVCFYHCNHLIICVHFYLFLYSFVILFLINSRLQYEGILKYMGESVTGIEIGIWNSHSSSCMVGKGKEVGGHWQMHR